MQIVLLFYNLQRLAGHLVSTVSIAIDAAHEEPIIKNPYLFKIENVKY